MAETLLDWLEKESQKAGLSKALFGEFMHDDNNSEEEKQDFLARVAEAGGYDALED